MKNHSLPTLLLSLTGLLLCTLCTVDAKDVPCSPRRGDAEQSYLCVCNSTYCDTVSSPGRLKESFYHHYRTSNSSPGFTHSKGSFSHQAVQSDVVFTIDPSAQYQEILGWGGAFTDSTGIMYNGLPAQAQSRFMESYFGPTGIEYNLCRVPIGSTDFGVSQYTLDEHPEDVDMKYFSLAEEDFTYRIPLIQNATAISRRGLKLLACSWAAPPWMKLQSNPHSLAGYVLEKYHKAWAKYHIKFVEAYKDQGLDIWSLSPGNEPQLLFVLQLREGSLNSSLDTAPSQRDWVKNHLKPQLVAANLTQIKVLIMEDQRVFAPYWMDEVSLDPKAYDAIDGIALHWYFDWYVSSKALDDIHDRHPTKSVMYTEACCNNDGFGNATVWLGSWFRAETYVYSIMQNLNHWATSFMDWNLILNDEGGPTSNYGVDAPIIANLTSGEFYKQPIFYAMGHFSKFMLPGATIIRVHSNQNYTSKDEPLVKLQSTEHMQAMFASRVNRSRGGLGDRIFEPLIVLPQNVTCIAASNPDSSFTVFVSNAKDVAANVTVVDPRVGNISVTVEQHSINTFVYWPPSQPTHEQEGEL